jgi:aminomethyltransferase
MVQEALAAIRPAWTPPAGTRKSVTPLYGVHRAFGAHFGKYADMTMPIRYAGETAEARAVRRGAGLFDLCYLGDVSVAGPEAAAMLDYALVGDVAGLRIGRSRYMMLCHSDGGILEDLVVARVDASEYVLVSNTTNVEQLIAELVARGTRFAARVDDRTEDYAVVAVEGPRSPDIVSRLTPVDPASLRYFENAETTVAGRDGVLARTGYTAEDGFEFYCAPDDATAVWYAFAEAGAAHGIQPAGLSCRDVLRLESGIPLCGRELTPAVTPYDAGLGRMVKLDKPDFVGKAALVARAQVPGEVSLFGLLGTGRRSPRAGHRVLDAEDGRLLGTVTSGAHSPTLRRPIAMAYLNIEAVARAHELVVDVRGRLEPVEITPLPFYGTRR